MRAAVVDAAGPPEVLHIAQVPDPQPGHGEVMVALDFAGVGIWDAEIRSGEWDTVKPGTILGVDGSGTIAALGAGVDRFNIGDRVYSYSYNNPSGGFYAEYVTVRADLVAPAPPQIRQDIAGGMPSVALTALSGLEALEVKREQTLLVFGASGGVGSLAVRLGYLTNATVVGTARPDAQNYVSSLGAAHVIDPRARHLEEEIQRAAPRGFDAALVTANGDTFATFAAHLRSGAAVAYPNGVDPEPVVERHPVIGYDGEMSREAFARLNATIGTETIPLEITTFSLDDVVEAHRRVEQGHVVGKIVLRIR